MDMALALRTNFRLYAAAALGIAAALCALLATLMVSMSSPVTFEPPGASVLRSHGESLNELPVSLRQPASEVFGRAHVGYWLKSVSGGFDGVNPAQRLRLRSQGLGIELTSPHGMHVRLTLAQVTAGASHFDLTHVVGRLDQNRVVYEAGGVQQSFINGPLGVEQRFSIRRPPVRVGARVDLVVGISGAHTELSPDGRSALLAAGNASAFRYAGLEANDSRGRPLPARMRLRHGQLVLEVQTRGARFPITVDPLLSPYAMLGGPARPTSAFGSSVALSADGNTAAIGGEGDDGGVGAVWIFTRSGASWSQQGPKLIPQGSNPLLRPPLIHNFGGVLAISASGNTIIVGDGRFSALAAWVFVRANGVWHQQGAPIAPRASAGYSSGSESVALSGDGRTAAFAGTISDRPFTWVYTWAHGRWRRQGRAIEAWGQGAALSANGSTLLLARDASEGGYAHVFVRVGARWSGRGGALSGSGAAGVSSGAALSSDGRIAIVGVSRGFALIYRRSRAKWLQVARLFSPSPLPHVHFGSPVALSGDGNTAMVGASASEATSGMTGADYVFARHKGDTWVATSTLPGEPGRAALSADGGTIVTPRPLPEVGERIEPSAAPAHVFIRAGSAWQQQATLAPSDAIGVDAESFGVDFALSADGGTALVSEGANLAWVFSRSGESWTRSGRLALEGTTLGGVEVALSADGDTAVLAGSSAPGPVAAWVFSRAGGAWSTHGTPLIASGAGPRPPGPVSEQESFGSSVAISADGDVILVGAAWDSGRTGAVWVFTRSGGGWAQQGPKLVPSSASAEESFGNSLALSADGTVALIGAVGDRQHPPEGPPPEGAAYVFTRSGATWAQTAKLIAEPNRYESQTALGTAVALSADGNTALLGSHNVALIFVRTPTGWQQHRPPLKPYGHENYALYQGRPAFGDVIALSADGTRALVGGVPEGGCGKYDTEACSSRSILWAFSRAGETWVRQPLPLVNGTSFGSRVALSGNGETALIRGVTPGPEPGGAVFASQLTPPPDAGFVIEPVRVEYEGALELEVWSPTRAAFKATARVTSPSGGLLNLGSGCSRTHASRKPRCRSGLPIYGTATAKGVENVALGIVPRPGIRKYLASHKHLRLTITISEQAAPPAPASKQTIAFNVSYIKTPAPEF
jgi:hypothetical protein